MEDNNQGLSIIIPVYNEENFLENSLPKIFKLDLPKEIIVVDDGSTDNSLDRLRELSGLYRFKLISLASNKGKGRAVRVGLENSKNDYFIVCDADSEYDPSDIVKLWQSRPKKNDKSAVYGSRWLEPHKKDWHFLVNWFLTMVTNILFKAYLTDMETCFKLIPTKALKDIDLVSNGFEIEPEITAKLIKAGYQIKEMPISYKRRGWNNGKKIRPRDGWIALKTLLKQRFK